MAKKAGQVQLQAEINNDDEWEKFLHRDGLLLVDIFSDWCGPCSGMSGNLKKIKLEIGGDMLQLGMAKCDHIEQLERFRKKSEPTWMFISKRKMVNLMFGADSPKLTRLIIDELKKEQMAASGERERTDVLEITDLSEEEQVRVEAEETIKRERAEREEAKKAKELLERRTAECTNILENLPGLGVAIVFPNAKDRYSAIMPDLLNEAGLVIQHADKIQVTDEMLEELFFFANEEEKEQINEASIEELLAKECVALLIKPHSGHEIESMVDEVLKLIYGEEMKPPGSDDSPARLLFEVVERVTKPPEEILIETEEEPAEVEQPPPAEPTEETLELIGMWAPPTATLTAVALKLFFAKVSLPYTIPEPEPTPPHLAIVFDIRKANDVMQVMNQYPKEILRYGFFTKDIPEEAEVVAKTFRKLEKCETRTFTEKLVLQVSKKKSECVFALVQLEPMYISPNATEGERECELFFPDEYDEPPEEVEEEEQEEEQPEEGAEGQEAAAEEGETEGETEEEQTEEEGEETDVTEEEGTAEFGDTFTPDMAMGEAPVEPPPPPEPAPEAAEAPPPPAPEAAEAEAPPPAEEG